MTSTAAMADTACLPRVGAFGDMDAWLADNRYTPAAMRRLVDAVCRCRVLGEDGDAAAAAAPSGLDAEAAWAFCGAAMADAPWSLAPAVHRAMAETVRDLSPQATGVGGTGGPRCVIPRAGQGPWLRSPYTGSVGDLLWLAHEFGHAVQAVAADGCDVPPVARETCAFLAELALLDHAAHRAPALAASLCAAWRRHAGRYYGADRIDLTAALDAAERPAAYDYRWNYPPAHLLARAIHRAGAGAAGAAGAVGALFRAEAPGFALLQPGRHDVEPMRANPLPPAPDAPDALAMLGIAAALEAEAWAPGLARPIGDWVARRAAAIAEGRVFLGVDGARRPVGFAHWRMREGEGPAIDGLTAPFVAPPLFRAGLAERLAAAPAGTPAENPGDPPGPGEAGVAAGRLSASTPDPYAVLGAALGLLAAAPYHRRRAAGAYLAIEILPPLRAGQLRLFPDAEGRPVGLVTWAWLTPEAEADVLATGRPLRAEEWGAGEAPGRDRLFFNDFVAPYGHAREIVLEIARGLFPDHVASSLQRAMDGSVQRVKRWVGANRRPARRRP